jgi:hypothetical protein
MRSAGLSVVAAIVIFSGCGSDEKRCTTSDDCEGRQLCFCAKSGPCSDEDDKPSGECVSRKDFEKRRCVARGKPENCYAQAELAAEVEALELEKMKLEHELKKQQALRAEFDRQISEYEAVLETAQSDAERAETSTRLKLLRKKRKELRPKPVKHD